MNLDTRLQRLRSEAVREIVFDLKPYWPMTLRGIHYQCFTRGIIWQVETKTKRPTPYGNKNSFYKTLSRLLTEMRVVEMVPWDAIKDGTRPVTDKRGQEDVSQAVNEAAAWLQSYERCLMKDQEVYIEVWTEKVALLGMLQRITDQFCIRLAGCVGFGSSTMGFEYACRARKAQAKGQRLVLLYVGDFDPSGMVMLGAIQKKLEREHGLQDVLYERVTLTLQQIKDYNLPHNSWALKKKDPNAAGFIKKYGLLSVELDALHPKVMQELVRSAIEKHIDLEVMQLQQEIEKKEALLLESFREGFLRLRVAHGI